MYLPPAFAEHDRSAHFDLIEAEPLGLLISHGGEGLLADHIPFLLDRERNLLLAHVAKGNAQWRNLGLGGDVLVVFRASDHYVTPSWYASKREHGKVVPTWNYVSVQVAGHAKVIDDALWLRRQIDRLTEQHEYQRDKPWATEDAPADFIAGQLRGIIGIEIAIHETTGKWKVSQNRNEADRAGVAAGLQAESDPRAVVMADHVRRGGA
jgi:transcriptional regulator